MKWGKIRWAQPAIGALLAAQADTVVFQLGPLLGGNQYLRLQTTLPVANDGMDDSSPANIETLANAARLLLAEQDEALTAFCQQLIGDAPVHMSQRN